MGISGVLFGFLGLILLFGDFVSERNLGAVVVVMVVLVWALGTYFIVLGGVWRARDRRGS
ncbi:hypothetical protein [Microbacterium sp. P05]|uniref:hypothetical protein n=1 Tax=Microbacterium sp. P05 TaxID=3366948 RepID=UPI003745B8B0